MGKTRLEMYRRRVEWGRILLVLIVWSFNEAPMGASQTRMASWELFFKQYHSSLYSVVHHTLFTLHNLLMRDVLDDPQRQLNLHHVDPHVQHSGLRKFFYSKLSKQIHFSVRNPFWNRHYIAKIWFCELFCPVLFSVFLFHSVVTVKKNPKCPKNKQTNKKLAAVVARHSP